MESNIDKTGFIQQKHSSTGVASLSFYHPSHNSFPRKLLAELSSMLEGMSKDESIKVIVLKSEGNRTFCAGASFDELLAIENLQAGKHFFSGFADLINAIRTNTKLIVGQVQGKAIGGGVGIAAACDYCFATEQASIRLSELGINIGPFVIAPAVERKIGLAAFSELMLNPEKYRDAQWAKEKGLYQEVLQDLPHLEQAVNTFSESLASRNLESLTAIKSILWENTEHWGQLLYERANTSGKLTLSAETKKSLRAFKNKKD